LSVDDSHQRDQCCENETLAEIFHALAP
jgi:hypothetical protein